MYHSCATPAKVTFRVDLPAKVTFRVDLPAKVTFRIDLPAKVTFRVDLPAQPMFYAALDDLHTPLQVNYCFLLASEHSQK